MPDRSDHWSEKPRPSNLWSESGALGITSDKTQLRSKESDLRLVYIMNQSVNFAVKYFLKKNDACSNNFNKEKPTIKVMLMKTKPNC